MRSASLQADPKSQTTDAVRGGSSWRKPKGSAFSALCPDGCMIQYLYRAPCPRPGTKPSQIPDEARGLSTCLVFDQPLKSPITWTFLAAGAQTAKNAPDLPSTSPRCAPSLSQSR